MGECIFLSPIPAGGRWENHFSQTYHLNGELCLALWAKLVSSKMNSSSQDGTDLVCTLVFCPKGCIMKWTWPVFVNSWCWLLPKFTQRRCTKLPSNFLIFFPTVQVMCVILSAKTGNWKSDLKKNLRQRYFLSCLWMFTEGKTLPNSKLEGITHKWNSTASSPSSYTFCPILFYSREE